MAMSAMTHDRSELLRRLHRMSLYGCIGFLCLGAVWGILAIVTGNFDWLELRVLLTAGIVSVSSGCLMVCVSFASRAAIRLLPVIGAGVVVLGAALLLIGMWGDVSSEEFWQFAAVVSVWGVAFTHAFLILAMRIHRRFLLPQLLVVLVTALLALMISGVIVEPDMLRFIGEDMYFRAIAVLAILTALGSVAMPILRRLSRDELERDEQVLAEHLDAADADDVETMAMLTATDDATEARTPLTLWPIGDGVYRDAEGRRYRLTPVNDDAE